MNDRRLFLGVALVALIHGLTHWFWFAETPLGQVAVLDGREQLELAHALASGTMVQEPFYRAPGYAYLLSVFLHLGWTDLLVAARFVNLLAFVLTALGVTLLARRLWQDRLAAGVAGAAVALNPVMVHHLVDPHDTLWAALLMVGTALLIDLARTRSGSRAGGLWILAGVVAGAGVWLRPHLLAFALGILAGLFWLRHGPRWWWPREWLAALLFGLGLGMILLSMGAVNHGVGGEFRVLPWQGSYDLYAANREGAHGKFYSQERVVAAEEVHRNPTRVEAEARFREEMGRDPESLEEWQGYWRGRFLERVRSDPGGWIAQLWSKGRILLHHYEQYNNRTYSLHREQSPVLRWNPFGWGFLLLLGVPGWIFWISRSAYARVLACGAAALLAGILLFYVSGRFRVPLHPWLALGGGATVVWLRGWDGTPVMMRVLPAAALVVAGCFAWINPPGLREPDTRQADYLLMAQAALVVGEDREVERAADLAIEHGAPWEVAGELWVLGRINQLLTGEIDSPGVEWFEEGRSRLRLRDPMGAVEQFADGIFAWGMGNRQEAIRRWREMGESGQRASVHLGLAALIVTGEASAEELARARATHPGGRHPYLQQALQLPEVLHPLFGLDPEAEAP